MKTLKLLLVSVLAITLRLNLFAVPEVLVSIPDAEINKIIAHAPKPPRDLGLDLNLKLVDYIDCTNPNDLHPMKDQGTSIITNGPAGKYRATAQGRNSFFSYRWRSAAQDVPHVLVIEYPDDAKREVCFLTHESGLSGVANSDWSLETGVYTGNPFPITNKMQYHTMFFWPQDKWPAIIVGNWNRQGAPAAASRIWIYRVVGDHLPAMKVEDANPSDPRIIGDLYNWSLVPVHNIFGLTSRETAFQHIVEYYQYLGCNLVSWPVVSNNNWGFKCRIDAWGPGDKNDQLEGILKECDAKGLKFLATFELGRSFTIKGKKLSDDKESWYKGFLEGFDEFIKRYGHHKSLYGIAFGTPDFGPRYGDATIDIIRENGGLEDFTNFINSRKQDLKIMTFIGGRDLHMQYFNNAWSVISKWENSNENWNQHLANVTLDLWKEWGRNPKEFTSIKGLTTVYQYQPDDHGIYDSYSQQPRSIFYFDQDQAAEKSANIDTRAVMLWNTFYESWFGLHPEVNFWYRKLWVAPDFNASEPFAGAAWARAMEHRDRNIILAGAWNKKAGGHEASYRIFAKNFRELPSGEMEDVKTTGNDAIKVRKLLFNGNTYISLINVSPFEQKADLNTGSDIKKVVLAPFAMQTIKTKSNSNISCVVNPNNIYTAYVQERINEFNNITSNLKKINPEAVTIQYNNHVNNAERLLRRNAVRAADVALGYGIPAELKLRERILKPQQFTVGKVQKVPQSMDKLDDWPEKALDIMGDNGSYLSTHLYFPNSWTGPEDLSARARICHNGEKMYLGVQVKDNVLHEKDGLTFWLSGSNYKKWQENEQKTELLSIGISAPHDGKTLTGSNENYSWSATPENGGYYFYAVIDMKQLKLSIGDSLGFLLRVPDHDATPNLYKANWTQDATMLIPHFETFSNWSDARTCQEIKLAE